MKQTRETKKTKGVIENTIKLTNSKCVHLLL